MLVDEAHTGDVVEEAKESLQENNSSERINKFSYLDKMFGATARCGKALTTRVIWACGQFKEIA